MMLLLDGSNFERDEKKAILHIAHLRGQGIRAARNRAMDHAQRFLHESSDLGSSRALSSKGQLLCRSFQMAAEAYFAYCQGNYALAEKHLQDAMLIDTHLANFPEFALLHLHRIQLLHNRVRIDFHCGRQTAAVDLAFRTIAHLDGSNDLVPELISYDKRSLRGLPKDLTDAMFTQIVSEIALMIVLPEMQEFGAEMITAHSNSSASGDGRSCSASRDWITMKQYFPDNKKIVLELCIAFLKRAHPVNQILWYATALDLLSICKDLRYRYAKFLALDLAMVRLPPTFVIALNLIVKDWI